VQRNLDLLADLDIDFAVLIPELLRGYDGFGLEADADDDDIGIYVDDGAGQDLAGLELLIRKTLFEKLLERFGHWVFRATGPIVVTFRTASRHSGSCANSARHPAPPSCRSNPASQCPRAA